MSGLAHVFPFQRAPTPPPVGEVQAPSPERKQVPAVLVDEAEAVAVQGNGDSTTRSQSSLAFENEQMQVFEPLEVGDLTPTPSEQSGGSPRRTSEETSKTESEGVTQTVDARTEAQVTDQSPAISNFSEETTLQSSSIETPHTSATSVEAGPVQDSVEESDDSIEFPAYSSAFMPASPPKPVPEMPREEPAKVADESTLKAHAPFPISHVAKKYYIHDPNTIAFVRREYNMCGVLVGTLPSHPQQNVFLGTPLSLMPEEARRLVDIGAAYIVDDTAAHRTGILGGAVPEAERKAFARAMEKQGIEAMRASQKKADDVKKEILKKNAEKIAAAREAKQKERQQKREDAMQTQGQSDGNAESESLFNAPAPRPSSPAPSSLKSTSSSDERYYITPTTSHPPLPTPPASPPNPSTALLPPVPSSYPLFAYLHSRGFFMTPGLRFGCQYTAYPGDPLRFHSHFLAVGMGWDEPFDLMRLVGGGRLGTGVKKAFLIGAREGDVGDGDAAEGVRAFSVEWSGM
ncbi:uncharacterized protein IWZ02DRAFT_466289 [Phyllosticta citriasiana]|uniref:tRNA-intron lyase n=1 Tax=Phyllosticta citriasiana TaxID=595635 RepID=A0ABR1KF73_9PEZI